jgi:hypothetical protein
VEIEMVVVDTSAWLETQYILPFLPLLFLSLEITKVYKPLSYRTYRLLSIINALLLSLATVLLLILSIKDGLIIVKLLVISTLIFEIIYIIDSFLVRARTIVWMSTQTLVVILITSIILYITVR